MLSATEMFFIFDGAGCRVRTGSVRTVLPCVARVRVAVQAFGKAVRDEIPWESAPISGLVHRSQPIGNPVVWPELAPISSNNLIVNSMLYIQSG